MSDEIEFGEIQHQKPDSALRPDQDPHWSVFPVGEISDDDMPIFVDLDVMRDMEGHARTNTNVELGGVMLGYQYHDSNEEPFVLVTDCLRAEHYEATKGSFKFTHETWQAISRQRDEYPEAIQMVGWYHTHPDWGVFLSGMDLFICNNFFNRPLDVALVIDPCRQDRGWFHWKFDQPDQTERTGGFYLYASRFRHDEIGHFANLYQGISTMASDPRYNPMSAPGGQSIVNIHDQRTPIQNVAIMGMLTIQMLVLALIAWKLLAPSGEDSKKLADLEKSMDVMAGSKLAQTREKATLKVLDEFIDANDGGKSMASKLVAEKMAKDKLQLDADASEVHRRSLKGKLAVSENKAARYKKDKDELKKTKKAQEKKIAELKAEKASGPGTLILIVGSILIAALGAIGGYVFKHYLGNEEDEFEDSKQAGEYSEDRLFTPDQIEPPADDGISLIDGESPENSGDASAENSDDDREGNHES